jgi:hypothetical protein
MPGKPEEFVALVNALLAGTGSLPAVDDFRWADGSAIADAEWRDVLALQAYAVRQRSLRLRSPSQRRAMRLLRGLLPADRRAELSRLRYFHVTTPAGATYRLDPRRGHAERVERHGRRWFVKRWYCLHDADDNGKLPPADVTIAHLLLLLADEPSFLGTANESRRDDQLWNGAYLRRIRAARAEREAMR